MRAPVFTALIGAAFSNRREEAKAERSDARMRGCAVEKVWPNVKWKKDLERQRLKLSAGSCLGGEWKERRFGSTGLGGQDTVYRQSFVS